MAQQPNMVHVVVEPQQRRGPSANWTFFQRGSHLIGTDEPVAAIDLDQAHVTDVQPKWIIMPGNPVKRIWDMLMLLIVLYMIIVMPLQVAFGADQVWETTMDFLIDGIFVVDIILVFFSGYELPNGDVVTSHKEIAKNYLRFWFALDVIASFPYYLIMDSNAANLTFVFKLPRLMKVVRFLRLLKLLRAYRFNELFDELEFSPKVHPGFFRCVKTLLLAMAFSHFSACVWYFLGEESNPDSWIVRTWRSDPIFLKSTGYRYLVSLYCTLTALTTVGFGDITARTDTEMIWTICMMIVGTTLFSYTTAIISSIIASGDSTTSGYRTKMHSLIHFMKGARLSRHMQEKLSRHLRYVWLQPPDWDWRNLLEDAPYELRYEVTMDIHRDLIGISPWFERVKQYQQLVVRVAMELRPAEFAAGSIIAKRFTPVDNWYIIADGTVEVVSPTSKRVYMELTEGMTFGDVGLFSSLGEWEGDMMAPSHVAAFFVPRDVLLSIVDYVDRLPSCGDGRCRATLTEMAEDRLTLLKEHGWRLGTSSPEETSSDDDGGAYSRGAARTSTRSAKGFGGKVSRAVTFRRSANNRSNVLTADMFRKPGSRLKSEKTGADASSQGKTSSSSGKPGSSDGGNVLVSELMASLTAAPRPSTQSQQAHSLLQQQQQQQQQQQLQAQAMSLAPSDPNSMAISRDVVVKNLTNAGLMSSRHLRDLSQRLKSAIGILQAIQPVQQSPQPQQQQQQSSTPTFTPASVAPVVMMEVPPPSQPTAAAAAAAEAAESSSDRVTR